MQANAKTVATMACLLAPTAAHSLPQSYSPWIGSGLESKVPPTAVGTLSIGQDVRPIAWGSIVTLLVPSPAVPEPHAFPIVDTVLESYRLLGDNWDGEGAIAPLAAAIDHALDVAHALPAVVPSPTPMVLSNGEVALYWKRGDSYAEIGFDGSGRFYAYATRPGTTPVCIDDEELFDGSGKIAVPESMLKMLGA